MNDKIWRSKAMRFWSMGWDAHEAYIDCGVGIDVLKAEVWDEGYEAGWTEGNQYEDGEVPWKPEVRGNPYGPELATADDVIEGRARYADTPGGHADRKIKRDDAVKDAALEVLRKKLTQ